MPFRFSHRSSKLVGISMIGVGVGEEEEAGVAEGAAAGDLEGTGLVTFTPLLQMSFLPFFMQVYLNPEIITVAFSLVQLAPVLTAADEMGVETLIISAADIKVAKVRLTREEYGMMLVN